MNKEDNVLIIHGNQKVRNNLREYLRRLGYSNIWGFDNTGNALKEIKKYKEYVPNILILSEELYNLCEILKRNTNYNAFTVGDFLSGEKGLEKLISYSKA